MLRLLGLTLLACALPWAAGAAAWSLGPDTAVAATVAWQGKPIAVRFPGLSGTVEFDARDLAGAKARLSVPAGAATTGNPVVDALVRSRDYLDAAAHPTIVFALDRLTRTSKDTADVDGRVTLRGVTRSVRLKARVLAFGPEKADPSSMRADFAISGAIDRRDFGSTAGVPDVSAILPLDIRLVMTAP